MITCVNNLRIIIVQFSTHLHSFPLITRERDERRQESTQRTRGNHFKMDEINVLMKENQFDVEINIDCIDSIFTWKERKKCRFYKQEW